MHDHHVGTEITQLVLSSILQLFLQIRTVSQTWWMDVFKEKKPKCCQLHTFLLHLWHVFFPLLQKICVTSYCLKEYLLPFLPITCYSRNISAFFCSMLTDCFVSPTAWSMILPSLQREICKAQAWTTVLQTLKLPAVCNVTTQTPFCLFYFHEKNCRFLRSP